MALDYHCCLCLFHMLFIHVLYLLPVCSLVIITDLIVQLSYCIVTKYMFLTSSEYMLDHSLSNIYCHMSGTVLFLLLVIHCLLECFSKLLHTFLKLFTFFHALHITPCARHYFVLCVDPHYLLFCCFCVFFFSLFFLDFCHCNISFWYNCLLHPNLFSSKLSSTVVCDLCTSTLLAYHATCSLVYITGVLMR